MYEIKIKNNAEPSVMKTKMIANIKKNNTRILPFTVLLFILGNESYFILLTIKIDKRKISGITKYIYGLAIDPSS